MCIIKVLYEQCSFKTMFSLQSCDMLTCHSLKEINNLELLESIKWNLLKSIFFLILPFRNTLFLQRLILLVYFDCHGPHHWFSHHWIYMQAVRLCWKQHNERLCEINRNKYKIYCNFKSTGVLKFDLGTDVHPEVSNTTL